MPPPLSTQVAHQILPRWLQDSIDKSCKWAVFKWRLPEHAAGWHDELSKRIEWRWTELGDVLSRLDGLSDAEKGEFFFQAIMAASTRYDSYIGTPIRSARKSLLKKYDDIHSKLKELAALLAEADEIKQLHAFTDDAPDLWDVLDDAFNAHQVWLTVLGEDRRQSFLDAATNQSRNGPTLSDMLNAWSDRLPGRESDIRFPSDRSAIYEKSQKAERDGLRLLIGAVDGFFAGLDRRKGSEEAAAEQFSIGATEPTTLGKRKAHPSTRRPTSAEVAALADVLFGVDAGKTSTKIIDSERHSATPAN